jgi:hypothetical protein
MPKPSRILPLACLFLCACASTSQTTPAPTNHPVDNQFIFRAQYISDGYIFKDEKSLAMTKVDVFKIDQVTQGELTSKIAIFSPPFKHPPLKGTTYVLTVHTSVPPRIDAGRAIFNSADTTLEKAP